AAGPDPRSRPILRDTNPLRAPGTPPDARTSRATWPGHGPKWRPLRRARTAIYADPSRPNRRAPYRDTAARARATQPRPRRRPRPRGTSIRVPGPRPQYPIADR